MLALCAVALAAGALAWEHVVDSALNDITWLPHGSQAPEEVRSTSISSSSDDVSFAQTVLIEPEHSHRYDVFPQRGIHVLYSHSYKEP